MDRSYKIIQFVDSEEISLVKAILLAPNLNREIQDEILIKNPDDIEELTYEQADKLRTDGYNLYNGKLENGSIIPAYRSYYIETGKLINVVFCMGDVMLDASNGTPYWLHFNEQTGFLEKAVSCTSPLPNESKPENSFRELSEHEISRLKKTLEVS